MQPPERSIVNRREFLRNTGAAASLAVAGGIAAAAKGPAVSIIVYPDDPVASAAPARWAADQLRNALHARGVPAEVHENLDQAAVGDFCIVSSGLGSAVSREVRKYAAVNIADTPEALGLIPGRASGRPVLLACGRDVRGLVYALLDLADRAENASDPVAILHLRAPVIESPANPIRSIARFFVSDVEDTSWYNDRAMWPNYLSMLAAQRFNRFALTLGIGYDFTRQIRDNYFHFAYPFLLAVPPYNVRASGVSDEERDRNLEMLKFIGNETVARGMDFQLGLWTHAYEWTDSPGANHTISGLNAKNHALYCRDALQKLLTACPSISGITFRIHGESGVPEQSYDFWKTVFTGIVRVNRPIEIDMHAKGIDQKMIDVALATGLPVNVSPKYWAEHMGLPYHQTQIRDQEMPKANKNDTFFALSSGSRSFLRYGYGDLLKEDRKYGVLYRIWPGTQRLLLWGSPAMAAAYGRASSFCGGSGAEICEPLSFKGRKGSGLPLGRTAYADKSLQPKWDWQKYLYTYRVWGRLLYNPDSDPDTWQRYLRHQFGAAALPVQSALAHASRILPLVTTAHGPSAANNNYWPEMYTNMPIVDAARPHPYSDTPSPKRFGTVSPFDPGLFSRIDDFAAELLNGKRSAKYSPIEVATWLEDLATSTKQMSVAESKIGSNQGPEFRRLAVDVAIESGLGRFFGAKLRSGVLFSIFEQTGDRAALDEALKAYRKARQAWWDLANRAKGVYVDDVTFGYDHHLRGNWLDRLPAIDQDIADMEALLPQAKTPSDPERARNAVKEAISPALGWSAQCKHTPPKRFAAGQPLPIELAMADAAKVSARVHFRHTNQAEAWRVEDMEAQGGRFKATIPGDYTGSPYPLEYYFEIRTRSNLPSLYPGLGIDLCQQPYFVVRRS
jgi:hypothetical protein